MKHVVLLMVLGAAGAAAADEEAVRGITLIRSVTASSTLAAKEPKRYAPERVFDLAMVDTEMPPQTAWCEGKPDEGIGESLTIELDAPAVIAKVAIKAGFWKSEDLFKKNNRVTEIDVVTDDGRTKSVKLGDEMEEKEVELGGAAVRKLTLKITKVKKGQMNDSCISQVTLSTKPETDTVLNMEPALADAIVRLEQALAKCDAKALAKAIQFPVPWIRTQEDGEAPGSFSNADTLARSCKDENDFSVRPKRSPGYVQDEKKAVTYLHDPGCGNDCIMWGFKKSNGWKLVWVGPEWKQPK